MTIPTKYVKNFEYSNISEPKNVAVAPNEMNTIEKPKAKSRVSFRRKFLFLSSKPSSVVPLIKEIYPGIKGKTQGDKKLIIPAKNDKKYKLIESLKFYLIHLYFQVHEFGHNHRYEYH